MAEEKGGNEAEEKGGNDVKITIEKLGATVTDGVSISGGHRLLGLKRGDFAYKFYGELVHKMEDFARIIKEKGGKPGDYAEIEFYRGSEVMKQMVALGCKQFPLAVLLKNLRMYRNRKPTTEITDGSFGTINVLVNWDDVSQKVQFKVKNVQDFPALKGKKIYLTMQFGSDTKKFPIQKSSYFKCTLDSVDINHEFVFKPGDYSKCSKAAALISIKTKKVFGSDPVLGSVKYDMCTLLEEEQDAIHHHYSLSGVENIVSSPLNEQDKCNLHTIKNTAVIKNLDFISELENCKAKLDVQFDSADGIKITSCVSASQVCLSQMTKGDIIVSILDDGVDTTNIQSLEYTPLKSCDELQQEINKRWKKLENVSEKVYVTVLYYRPILQDAADVDILVTKLLINDYAICDYHGRANDADADADADAADVDAADADAADADADADADAE